MRVNGEVVYQLSVLSQVQENLLVGFAGKFTCKNQGSLMLIGIGQFQSLSEFRSVCSCKLYSIGV